MRQLITKLPPKSLIKHLISIQSPCLRFSLSAHSFSTATESKPGKLNRIADELLSLNAVELHDYSILFGLKMGLKTAGPGSISSGPGQAAAQGGEAGVAKAEKTAFDVKLEKFDAGAKIKIIKEVRSFTELGLKEAKDLVEKSPCVVKNGVTKEEGESIVEKLKQLGATVVLE
ncbi:hypothetical protein RND81_03G226000 [Saponaria officinalis]|uniref:Large ribosomal subunit protein bL12 C-terminal domain-containing protein n=1 Tax=Saponaria officinalis TaxID=3572 RepID=A0AAW1MAC0_SAPOF